MSDSLTVFGTNFTGVTGIKATGTGNGTLTYVRPQGTKSITANGTGIDVTQYATVDVSVSGGGSPTLQAKTATPTTSQQVIEPDSGYDGLSSVTVDAMPTGSAATPATSVTANPTISVGSDGLITATVSATKSVTPTVSAGYVSSGTAGTVTVSGSATEQMTLRSSTDLTASGATVTAPAGYYASSASKSVSSGTEGTPTATKGSVSNHAISVTPSVTNAAGYIAGGTHSGTAVSVAASELVSGTVTISGSGTTDVTNYATASVATGGATASATKGSVSNHSISVTPSVTRTAGWVTAGSANGTAVTVSASELVSGNKAITSNGTNIDVANYSTVSVDVSGNGYTLTTIVPQQTVTPNSSRQATLSNFAAAGLVEGESYLVTLDGTEYIETCGVLWSNNYVIGDQAIIFGTSDIQLPFAIDWVSASDNVLVTLDTSQHTVKVEHIELGSGATVLTTKTITANGTYTASTDSADGYSSVTVSVPSGSPSLQAKTNISPTTSSQTITADSGYDGLSSVQINAMPSMTLPTAASATSSGTSKATITPGSSAQYINIPTGYNASAAYYTIAATSGGGASIDTKTATASNYPVSISFTSMKGQPKAFFLRSTSQISSSGNTTYYYIIDMVYDGNSNNYCDGNCFRIGSTRRVDPITTSSSGGTVTGYTWSYSGTTLTITTSAASRSASPGAFNNGYQLVYVY